MKRFFAVVCAVLLAGCLCLPGSAAGRIVYAEDFDDVSDYAQLGWERIGDSGTVYTIEEGQLLVDNMAYGRDSYVVMVPEGLMRDVIAGDYTVQYDMTYLQAGDASRYLAVLLNYDRLSGNTYNSLHIRMKGNGNWQIRNQGQWGNLDSAGVDGRQPIATTAAGQTLGELALGVVYDGSTYVLRDKTFTVRQEVHAGAGVKIYVNDVFITGTDEAGWAQFMSIADPITGASEIALKAGATIRAYFDNFVVATGIGIPAPEPETTLPPETTPPVVETAPIETEAVKESDITVGAAVYVLAILVLGVWIAAIVKRESLSRGK